MPGKNIFSKLTQFFRPQATAPKPSPKPSLLTKTFNELAFEGIIGPHNGLETAMALKGLKPVIMIDEVNITPDNLERLRQAVREGKLKSVTITPEQCSEITTNEYFFCQNDKEEDMNELVRFYTELWSGQRSGISREMYRRIGNILGYSEKDTELFIGNMTNKPTENYTLKEIRFLYDTSEQRRRERYRQLTHSEPHQPASPAARYDA